MNNSRSHPAAIVAVTLAPVALIAIASFFQLQAQYQVSLIIGLVAALAILPFRLSALHVMLAVTLYMFAHTHASRSIPGAAEVARAAALGVLFIVVAKSRTSREPRETLTELTWLAILGLGVYSVPAMTHGFDTEIGTDLVSFMVAIVSLNIFSRGLRADATRRGIELALLLAMALSLAAVLFTPGTAIQAGRLEGVFANANTLGFFAAVAILFVITIRKSRLSPPIFLMAAVALLASGSRSPLLAVAVALIVTSLRALALAERGTQRLLITTAIGCLASYLLISYLQPQDVSILRDNNSRAGGTEYALQVYRLHPWVGLGYGNSRIEIASTPLRWLAEGGRVSFVLVILAYVGVIVLAARRSWVALVFAAFGVVSSIFEGWYFAGGSGLFFIYWLAYVTSCAQTPSLVSSGVTDAPKNAGVQSNGAGRGGLRGYLSQTREQAPRVGKSGPGALPRLH